MTKENVAPLSVQVVGLSQSFLEEVWLALKEQSGISVSLRQEGVEALLKQNGSPPADVLIVRKTTRSDSFYDTVSEYIGRHPGVNVILSAPYKDPDMMVRALRAGVKEFLFEPFQEGEIQSVVRRLGGHYGLDTVPHRARVLAFMPCKGGSGATFIATNLAHNLAGPHGKDVLLIDLNLQFGDAYLYLTDRPPQTTLGEVCGSFVRFDYQFLDSAVVKLASGLRLLAAPQSPADAELVKPEHLEAIVAEARRHFDFVLLDVGRTLDAVSLKALDLADEVYPVLQMTLPSIRDGQRMKSVFDSLNYPESKVRWVVNRDGGQGGLAMADVVRVVGKTFWNVPNDHRHVEEAVLQGEPVSEIHPHSAAGRSLSRFADELLLAEAPEKPRKHWFSFGHRG